MHRRAQIAGDTVTNIAVFDDENIPDWAVDWPILPEGAGFGWSFMGGEWKPPVEEVVEE